VFGSEFSFSVERVISFVLKWLRICTERSPSLLFFGGGFKEIAVNCSLGDPGGGGSHRACFAFNVQSERTIVRSCCRFHSEVNDDIWCDYIFNIQNKTIAVCDKQDICCTIFVLHVALQVSA
jgi:hypothetical protein